MTLGPGTRLGPYEIVAAVGAGGMGEVYRARDRRLNRDVAIKVLPTAFAADPDRLRRFRQEALLLSALNHPALLAIYDVGSEGDVHYLVSEFLEGRTLRVALEGGALPLRQAIGYGLQLAAALAAAHEKGVVHRDLKPGKIFDTRDERVKILDFGLATKAPEADADADGEVTRTAMTSAGAVLGTAGYMSPEQVAGQRADHRADIFSLGAILYEMVSGARAFAGPSAVEMMNAILKEEPADLPPEITAGNPALAAVIHRCLQKVPARRFQSASDLAFTIESVSTMVPPASRSATVTRSTFAGLARPALVAVLVAAAAAAGWWLHVPPTSHVSYLRMTLSPLTVFNARFAPDGDTVVFSAALEGNVPELYVHRPDAPDGRRLDVAEAEVVAVSSKNEIALLTHARFIKHRWFTGTLSTMDMSGGAPKEILENVNDADWSPDGSRLAVLHTVDGRQRVEFPIGTVLYQTTGYMTDLRVSPAGDRLAFMEHPAGVDDRGTVAIVDLQGHVTTLTDPAAGEEGLAWAPSGREIYFSTASDEVLARLVVRAVDLSKQVRPVLEGADYLTIYDVNRRGQFIVSEGAERYQVEGRGLDATSRGLSWLSQSGAAFVTADGRRMVLTEFEITPNYAVGLRGTDGSPVSRLGDGVACDLSKDGGRALAYIPTSPMQLVIYRTGPGQPLKLSRGVIQDYTSCRFFRDMRRILICGRERDRAPRCYVQPAADGPPVPVTPEGTSEGLPSPDGRFVIARRADGSHSVFPLDTGAPQPLAGIRRDDTVLDWTADGHAVLVGRLSTIPAPIDRFDVATGRRTRIAELAPANRAGTLLIMNASFADDLKSYVYSYESLPTRLALVTGAR